MCEVGLVYSDLDQSALVRLVIIMAIRRGNAVCVTRHGCTADDDTILLLK